MAVGNTSKLGWWQLWAGKPHARLSELVTRCNLRSVFSLLIVVDKARAGSGGDWRVCWCAQLGDGSTLKRQTRRTLSPQGGLPPTACYTCTVGFIAHGLDVWSLLEALLDESTSSVAWHA